MFVKALPSKIEVSGVEVSLLTKGSGRPLLYLHSGDGVDGTEPILELLAQKFKVIAPSHPGFGDSQLPAHFSSVDDLAYFYLDLAEQLDLQDAILFGASFGGWIAAEIAIKASSRFSSLVLVGALGVKFSDRVTRDIPDIFSLPVKELPSLLFSDIKRGQEAFSNLDFPALGEDAARRFARNREALALFAWSPRMHNPKLRNRLHRIQIPTLVLWGDGDKFVTPGHGRSFANAIPKSRFELVKEAGHYAHIERPVETAESTIDFLRFQDQRRMS